MGIKELATIQLTVMGRMVGPILSSTFFRRGVGIVSNWQEDELPGSRCQWTDTLFRVESVGQTG